MATKLQTFLHTLVDHVGAGALHSLIDDLDKADAKAPETDDGKEDTTNA